MERKTSGLVYQDMLWEVVRAVRKAAPADAQNGRIRISVTPLCQTADGWIGGISDFSVRYADGDICKHEFLFKLKPDSPFVQLGVEESAARATVNVSDKAFLQIRVSVSGMAPADGMSCARTGIEKAKLFFEELLHFCSVEVHE